MKYHTIAGNLYLKELRRICNILSLYGYTFDKSNIRHYNSIDENTTFEETK